MSKPGRYAILLLAAMLPLAAACTTSMMSGQDWMRSSVASARVENQRHLDAVRAAASLPVVASEMNRHDSAMTGMMTDMDGAMDDMQHCTGPGMQQMTDMRAQMTDEMSAHDTAMGGSADLPTSRTEAERHAATMGGMMTGIDGALGNMDCGMH